MMILGDCDQAIMNHDIMSDTLEGETVVMMANDHH